MPQEVELSAKLLLRVGVLTFAAAFVGACDPGPGPHPGEMDGYVWTESDTKPGKSAAETPLSTGLNVQIYADTNSNEDAEPLSDTPVGAALAIDSLGHFQSGKLDPGNYFARLSGTFPAGWPQTEFCSPVVQVSSTSTGGAHLDFALTSTALANCP
jgi:hypothetical protein